MSEPADLEKRPYRTTYIKGGCVYHVEENLSFSSEDRKFSVMVTLHAGPIYVGHRATGYLTYQKKLLAEARDDAYAQMDLAMRMTDHA